MPHTITISSAQICAHVLKVQADQRSEAARVAELARKGTLDKLQAADRIDVHKHRGCECGDVIATLLFAHDAPRSFLQGLRACTDKFEAELLSLSYQTRRLGIEVTELPVEEIAAAAPPAERCA